MVLFGFAGFLPPSLLTMPNQNRAGAGRPTMAFFQKSTCLEARLSHIIVVEWGFFSPLPFPFPLFLSLFLRIQPYVVISTSSAYPLQLLENQHTLQARTHLLFFPSSLLLSLPLSPD